MAELQAKLKIHDIAYKPRGKNQQALFDLEIPPQRRDEIIRSLTVENYSEGPKDELLDKGSDMWIFGTTIRKKEVYIKISKGLENGMVICHSFHVAERKMKYPFKK